MEITTGVWRISCEGLWLNVQDDRILLLDNQEGDATKWRLDTQEPGKAGFSITNIATGISVWATPSPGRPIGGGTPMAWYIQSSGASLFHISFPDHDLLWTSDGHPGPVRLVPSEGTPTQQWGFSWVGDF